MGDIILEIIRQELYVLVPVLWIIGNFLRKTPYIKPWYIPWILLSLGIVLTCSLIGLTVEAVIQGILAAGGATLLHQLIKQTRERN